MPKAIGGKNIKQKTDNKLNKANDPLKKKILSFCSF